LVYTWTQVKRRPMSTQPKNCGERTGALAQLVLCVRTLSTLKRDLVNQHKSSILRVWLRVVVVKCKGKSCLLLFVDVSFIRL
jgi:ribosomal protein S3AE